MSSWAAEEETDSDEEVQQPVSPTPVVAETAPAPRPSRAPAKSTPMIGLMLGINFDAHQEDIEDFLRHNEIKFVHIEMLEGKDGHFSGRAKIEFSEDSSFERFIGLNGAEFMNKDIITKEWESRERAPRGGNGGRRGGDRDRDDRRPRPTSGGFNDARKQPHDYAPRSDRDFPNRGNRDYQPRERGDRGDRDRHSNNRERNNNSQSNSAAASSAPAERPRLQLAPRTKPIEEIGKPEARADIFGGGRPHDELEFQRRKQVEKTTDAAEEVAGNEHSSTAGENNNNSKKGRKENSKPASAGGEKRERKDKKDRKERSKDASEQQDSTLAEEVSKLQVSETPAAAPGEVDGDFTVVERGGKKKTNAVGAPPASSSNVKKNNSNSNNNKGAKNGPPRQEHANSRNSNRNKDNHSNNNNNNKPASAAGVKKEAAGASSTSPSATAAPSPKLPSNAANKTAFAGLADDSDHDD